MNILLPFLAGLLQAGSFTLDKMILSVRRVDFRIYLGASYPLVFLATGVVFLIFRPPLPSTFFLGRSLVVLIASIVLSTGTNLIFYRALQRDSLAEIQTLDLLSNLPIIVFSTLFFPDERHPWVVVAALVAATATVWSHWDGRRLTIPKSSLAFLIWSVTAAPVNAALSKILLQTWHPVTVQFVRSGTIALILGPLFPVHLRRLPHRALHLLLMTNTLTSVAWILLYVSYQRFGVIYTTLVFMLQPLLVYAAAVWLLNEMPDRRKSAAFAVLLASIVAASILR